MDKNEKEPIRTYSQYGVTLQYADADEITCVERDGRVAAKGNWFEDKVLDFLHKNGKSRFTIQRTGKGKMTVRRV